LTIEVRRSFTAINGNIQPRSSSSGPAEAQNGDMGMRKRCLTSKHDSKIHNKAEIIGKTEKLHGRAPQREENLEWTMEIVVKTATNRGGMWKIN
jgi:hypothetical protein